MKSLKHYSEWLRAERKAQERTLASVASEAGISIGHLSDIERQRRSPSLKVLVRIMLALGYRMSVHFDLAAPEQANEQPAPAPSDDPA